MTGALLVVVIVVGAATSGVAAATVQVRSGSVALALAAFCLGIATTLLFAMPLLVALADGS